MSRLAGPPRQLTAPERDLLLHLLQNTAGASRLVGEPSGRLVQEMQDGGMRSLQFHSNRPERRFGSIVAEGNFHDSDGTLVSVAVIIDTEGQIYELDIWKVDFSALIGIPATAKIRVRPFGSTGIADSRSPG
ncbi:MAG: hypothetical protein ABI399_09665 [Bauldia sp.]